MTINQVLYIIAGVLAVYIFISILVNRKFTTGDAIAFLGIVVSVILALQISPKDFPRSSTPTRLSNTTAIAGTWTGTIIGETYPDFSAELEISIQASCSIGKICGTFSVPSIECLGNLTLVDINGETYYFQEDSCGGGSEQITLLSNGTLSWIFQGEGVRSHATLSRK